MNSNTLLSIVAIGIALVSIYFTIRSFDLDKKAHSFGTLHSLNVDIDILEKEYDPKNIKREEIAEKVRNKLDFIVYAWKNGYISFNDAKYFKSLFLTWVPRIVMDKYNEDELRKESPELMELYERFKFLEKES